MEIKIRRTQIIGTRLVVFSAWMKPDEQRAIHFPYSTMTTIDGAWFGQIGTEQLPAGIEALRGDDRLVAFKHWRQETYQRAYDLILAQHPEAREGKRDMGQIEIWLSE